MANGLGLKRKDLAADKFVMETALRMADAVFDQAMTEDNLLWRALRKDNPDRSIDAIRSKFVRALAPNLLGDARATLAAMLGSTVPEELKSEIYDALLRDAAIGRTDRRHLTQH